jgi:hypothetical protein
MTTTTPAPCSAASTPVCRTNYPSGTPAALQCEAGFEQHDALGRFQHIEAVVQDFGLSAPPAAST